MGVGPARRFNAVGDHALSQVEKRWCAALPPTATSGVRFWRRDKLHGPASERIDGGIPVGASPVAVPRT